MQRLATIFFTLIIAACLTNAGYAVAKKPVVKAVHIANKVPARLIIDTSKIQAKQFNANAINKYKADKEFDYTDNAGAGMPSFWHRFWHWVWEKLFGWLRRSPYAGSVIEYIFLAAGIALLIFVIFKSLGIDPIQLFRGESRKINVPYTESLENIHEINFDAEIEKAIAQNNFRLAVRLLYLKCLKQLSDSQLINWQIDKTNAVYLNELTDPNQKQTFGLITRQFEYVWYGNFTIDKQAFGNISQLFQNFKKLLP